MHKVIQKIKPVSVFCWTVCIYGLKYWWIHRISFEASFFWLNRTFLGNISWFSIFLNQVPLLYGHKCSNQSFKKSLENLKSHASLVNLNISNTIWVVLGVISTVFRACVKVSTLITGEYDNIWIELVPIL